MLIATGSGLRGSDLLSDALD